MSGAKKEPQTQKPHEQYQRTFWTIRGPYPIKQRFEGNRSRKFTRKFCKIFVAKILWGTFSVPENDFRNSFGTDGKGPKIQKTQDLPPALKFLSELENLKRGKCLLLFYSKRCFVEALRPCPKRLLTPSPRNSQNYGPCTVPGNPNPKAQGKPSK